MAVGRYKALISNKVSEVLKKSSNNLEINPRLIESLLSLSGSSKKDDTIKLHLPCKELQNSCKDIKEKDLNYVTNIKHDTIVQNICSSKNKEKPIITFDLNKDLFVRDILSDKNYFSNLKNPSVNQEEIKEKVVIEFSSPNVAKPFHMGHFRSTIIGNYLSNLYEHLSYDVVRLTYLGDWGTQFGLLQIGLDNMGLTVEEISKNPTEILFKAYVNVNKEINTNPDILSKAKEIFNTMERGNNDNVLERWKMIRQFTIEELKSTYERVGVQFSDYDWESNYPSCKSVPVINLLSSKNLLHNEDGKLVFKLKSGGKITVLKSDGSSLYITRDILAAMDRHTKYNFDKMIYVTDFSQQDHFIALNEILSVIDNKYADKIQHMKYGRIRGMSTRKGEVVFLKDILNEAREIMAEKQKASLTTKQNLDENTSDILGISAVIVNDLRQRRLRDYEFNWDTALQMKGDSGIKLQYTHCRLVSLEENCCTELPDLCDPNFLKEPEAVGLIQEIARFDEIIKVSFSKQEAYFLVYYLFKLCAAVNRGLKVLPVKNSPPVLASQRLLLFNCARIVLNRGMKILGLKPLKKM